MKPRTKSLPVLVLVAVVALILGSFGTAVGAPAITKQKVKKIAAKVVKKQAPTLSVANAANAAQAANATNLNNLPASSYLGRVGFAFDDSFPMPAVGGGTEVLAVNITQPTGNNFIHINAVGTYFGGTTISTLWYQLDGTCAVTGQGFVNRTYMDTSNTSGVGAGSVNFVVPAAAGVHTVRLCGRTNAANTLLSTSLSVETVANGASGGTTITRPGPVSSDARPDAR